jgi:hypothetical protein
LIFLRFEMAIVTLSYRENAGKRDRKRRGDFQLRRFPVIAGYTAYQQLKPNPSWTLNGVKLSLW